MSKKLPSLLMSKPILWLYAGILVFACIFSAQTVSAQGVTTAAVNGLVTDNNGQPVYGANVIAMHVPSGTRFGAATRADGRFNIPAMRVGGPYTIFVTYIGYKEDRREGITLALGENRRIDFKMIEEAIEGEAIVVVSERNPIISETRTGTSQTITTRQIETMPTISRDFADFTKLTPQFSGNSVAGRNNRYNSILIDGSVNNDLFGLAGNGLPGGQAGTNPISLDAIQEFQVEIAPYDVRKGGFTGGGINAITRSGTNDYSGSVYYFTRNESFVGEGPDEVKVADFSQYTTGLRIGGPIIKDKLFFFVNGEYTKRSAPIGLGITGKGDNTDFTALSGITVAQAEEFKDVLMNQYGYDPGSFNNKNTVRPSTKIFARLDYNFDENHRLTLRHNFVDATDEILGRSTGTGSSSGFRFSNGAYDFANTTNSTVLQLNSVLGKNLHNEAIIAYQTIRDKRDTYGERFPTVRVNYGTSLLVAGNENFSQANSLDQNIIEFTDNVTYYMGDHTIVAGTHNEIFDFDNLFIRNFYGNYTFANIDSLRHGSPSAYELSYSLDPTDPKPTAKFGVSQIGFYVQDIWRVMPNINVTAGVRLDIPFMNDKPSKNALVDTTVFLDGIVAHTNEVPKANALFSPRVGVNWDVFSDKTTQVRGGIGIFSGRAPYVWISNQYGNTGVEFGRTTTNPGVGGFSADPDNQPGKVFVAPTSEINVTDPDFMLPQVWRFNLGVDHELPMGIIGTIDILASKNINAIRYQDINIKPAGTTRQLSASGDPDGSVPVYSTSATGKFNSQFTNVIYLSNTDNGYEYSLTGQLQKTFGQGMLGRFDKGFFASFAYTYGRAFDENSGTSSQAISNWRFNPINGDPNHVGSATANYETRHRIVSMLSYDFEFLPKYTTTFTFVYTGFSGRPYSETYSGDVNGDGQTSNDLIYVPSGRTDINIVPVSNDPRTADEIWEQLNDYIEGDPALDKARGKFIKRNASREPWTNYVDFHFAQQIPIPVKNGHRFELTWDVQNFMNWLNKDWGVSKFVANQDNTKLIYRGIISGAPAFTYGTVSSSGVVTISDRFQTSDLGSRWQMQLGVRYTF